MSKILYISHSFVTDVNRKIGLNFLNYGYDILLVTPQIIKTYNFVKHADNGTTNSNIIFLNTLFTNPRIQIYKGLRNVIKKFNPDFIIYDNDPYCLQLLFIILMKSKNQKLYSVTCENMDFKLFGLGASNFVKTIFKFILTPFLRKRITGIYTVNKEGTNIFNNKGFKNVNQMPIGFDSNKFKINLKTRELYRNKLKISSVCIGYFGRVCYEKGLEILLVALNNIKSYDWVFVMDEFKDYKDPYILNIKTLIKKYDLESRIIFVNPTHNNIQNYINAVDIVVLPSISTKIWIEQYGRVISESLACGKHILVSSSGHLPDLVIDFGQVFKEGDVNDLTKKLNNLLSKDFIFKANKKGSVYAHENLSINKQTEIFINTLL
ncbi:MAG: glycosyltransferase family 4 protein [Lutibacter sp.]|nr:glycosyltransferase family 4 protein [Lutibacter sp.]